MCEWCGRILNPVLMHAPPYLTPPSTYDSPLEYRFAHQAVKYLRPGTDLQKQVPVATSIGGFRLDFLVEVDGSRVAFECDGGEFHTSADDWLRDKQRDAAILATGLTDVIYRVNGKCLWFRPEDVFYAVSRWNPEIFSERALVNLARLASPALKSSDFDPAERVVGCRYEYHQDDADKPDIRRFEIERRTRLNLPAHRVATAVTPLAPV